MDESAFVPKSASVDYTDIYWCPVVNVVVKQGDKILLVKRNAAMGLYPNCWSGVSGFLDDSKSVKEKTIEELREALGLMPEQIKLIELCGIFNQYAPTINKTLIVHAVRATIDVNAEIRLDREAEEYVWETYPLSKLYDLLPGFGTVLALTCERPNAVVEVFPQP